MPPEHKGCWGQWFLMEEPRNQYCYSLTTITGRPNVHPSLTSLQNVSCKPEPGLWILRASPSPTPYSGIKMPLNISTVTSGRAGGISCEILEQHLFQKLSLMVDPVLILSSGRKRIRDNSVPETKRPISVQSLRFLRESSETCFHEISQPRIWISGDAGFSFLMFFGLYYQVRSHCMYKGFKPRGVG